MGKSDLKLFKKEGEGLDARSSGTKTGCLKSNSVCVLCRTAGQHWLGWKGKVESPWGEGEKKQGERERHSPVEKEEKREKFSDSPQRLLTPSRGAQNHSAYLGVVFYICIKVLDTSFHK
jgi:hypothetical protein